MYAIVKTGGKQYRVQQGQSLLVERLPAGDGEQVSLQPLLFVDGSEVVDGADELARVTVGARVLGHERGPKLRVVKFKPKRGYRRRTGHRQELTRLEVTEIRFAGGRGAESASAPEAASGSDSASAPEAASGPDSASAPKAASAPDLASAPKAASAQQSASAPGSASGAEAASAPSQAQEVTNGA